MRTLVERVSVLINNQRYSCIVYSCSRNLGPRSIFGASIGGTITPSISDHFSSELASGKKRKLYLSSHQVVPLFSFFTSVIRSYPYWVFFSFSRNAYGQEVTYPSGPSRSVRIRSIISDLRIGYVSRSSMSEFFSGALKVTTPSFFEVIETFERKAFIFSFGGKSLNAFIVAITSSVLIVVPSDHFPDQVSVHSIEEMSSMLQ